MKIMNRIILALAVVACAAVVTPCYGKAKIVKGSAKTMDTLSYCTGMTVGVALLEQNSLPISDMNVSELNKGIVDLLTNKSKISAVDAEKEIATIMEGAYNRELENLVRSGKAPDNQIMLKLNKAECKMVSYATGVAFGGFLLDAVKGEEFTLQYYWVCQAIEDVCAKGKPMLSVEQMKAFVERQEAAEAAKKRPSVDIGDKTKLDTLSYAIGANVGSGIKQQLGDINLDIAVVQTAIAEVLVNKSKMSHEDSLTILSEFFSNTLPSRQEAHKEVLKKDAGAVFKAFVDEVECLTVSNALGVDIGNNILKGSMEIQGYWLLEGFNDAWNGHTRLSQEQIMSYLQSYFTVVAPAKAAERSAKWLAQKQVEPGVQKSESGLLYKIIEVGDMKRAAKSDDDVVKVHYIGRLQNGVVFDASRFENRSKEQREMIRLQNPTMFDAKGKIIKENPLEFPLRQVIPGWTEGMKLIGPGGKILLYIPAELAYGSRGAGNDIGPNEALEFEVELIDVTPAQK